MKIGDILVQENTPLYLAPMAGVTDATFRRLCRNEGATLACTEMVSAKALLYGNKNTELLLLREPNEGILATQLFGSDPEIMGQMATRLSERFDIIDVNMGCPVPKIVNNGEGSSLMKDISLAEKILSTMVKECNRPVTVKFRLGFDGEHINAVDFARMAEAAGVAAIAVHTRTRDEYYSGHAHWDELAKVKAAVGIPVFGNGDVVDGASARRMKDECGVDGIMIGRAAQGNPWIFREVRAALDGHTYIPPSAEERRSVILEHAKGQVSSKGEYVGIREMRKHLAWYSKGMKGSAALRAKMSNVETLNSLINIVDEMFEGE